MPSNHIPKHHHDHMTRPDILALQMTRVLHAQTKILQALAIIEGHSTARRHRAMDPGERADLRAYLQEAAALVNKATTD